MLHPTIAHLEPQLRELYGETLFDFYLVGMIGESRFEASWPGDTGPEDHPMWGTFVRMVIEDKSESNVLYVTFVFKENDPRPSETVKKLDELLKKNLDKDIDRRVSPDRGHLFKSEFRQKWGGSPWTYPKSHPIEIILSRLKPTSRLAFESDYRGYDITIDLTTQVLLEGYRALVPFEDESQRNLLDLYYQREASALVDMLGSLHRARKLQIHDKNIIQWDQVDYVMEGIPAVLHSIDIEKGHPARFEHVLG